MVDQVSSFNTSHLHEVVFSDRHYINKLDQVKDLLLHIEQDLCKPWQKVFMLIRPRGFGLSLANEAIEALYTRDELLLNHMDSLQQEKEDPFTLEGIAEYPVIRLGFHSIKISSVADLEELLADVLQRQLWDHHIKHKMTSSPNPRRYFMHLITELAKRHEQKVVVLIDNYDAPIIAASMLKSPEEQEKALAMYFDMLNTIRQLNEVVNFCLLTGHCKFALSSQVSEGLPHIIDLSYSDKTATLFGFTLEEVKDFYKNELERIAPQHGSTVSEYLEALNQSYGGFIFSDKLESVLCPYSVTRALDNDGELYAYACDNEYSFLKNVYENEQPNLDWLFNKDGQDALFLEAIDIHPQGKDFGSLLLQLGFVSINKVTFADQEHSLSWRYRFGITNVEMRRALNIIMGKARPELRELPINVRVFDAGESDYAIETKDS